MIKQKEYIEQMHSQLLSMPKPEPGYIQLDGL